MKSAPTNDIRIIHRCGHAQRHTVYGDPERRKEAELALQEQDCHQCQIADARAYAKAYGLPPIQWGSDGQVGWAEVIRSRLLRVVERELPSPTPEQSEAIRRLSWNDRARYWIARRHADPGAIVAAWARNVMAERDLKDVTER